MQRRKVTVHHGHIMAAVAAVLSIHFVPRVLDILCLIVADVLARRVFGGA